jgi:hypothetical protein
MSEPAADLSQARALLRDGRAQQAVALYRRLLQDDPRDVAALSGLGEALGALGRHPQAVTAFAAAVERAPDDAALRFGLGNALYFSGSVDEALDQMQRADALAPDTPAVLNNLAVLHQAAGRPATAAPLLDRAIALAPDNATYRLERAYLRLTEGDLAGGFDDYEARFTAAGAAAMGFPDAAALHALPPMWQGEALGERGLLVVGEQGPGDMVMFAGCLHDLERFSAHIVVRTENRLTALLERAFPSMHVEGFPRSRDAWQAPFGDRAWIAMGSLPRLLRRTPADFPSRSRYLQSDPTQVADWRRRLAALGPGPRVGIAWRAGRLAHEQARRSVPLDRWLPVLAQPGVQWISLQYGDAADELAALAAARGIRVATWPDFDPQEDLDSLAALIEALDLVVTVANTTVHFAGALGRPVWALVPAMPSWRWQRDRDDSPWYPSLRLFRQASGEDWGAVLQRVAERLAVERDALPDM